MDADHPGNLESFARCFTASEALSGAAKALTQANTAYEQASGDSAKSEAKSKVLVAEENLKAKLVELSDRVLEKWALETRGSGRLVASTSGTVSGLADIPLAQLDLKAIHRAYLDDDDIGTLLDACLTSMEDNAIVLDDEKSSSYTAKIAEINSLLTEAVEILEHKKKTLPQQQQQQQQQQQLIISDPLITEKRRIARLNEELDRLQTEQSGAGDRTSLLTFCKLRMSEILRIVGSQVANRQSLERSAKVAEVCKGAIVSKDVNETIKLRCLDSLMGFRPE